MANDAAGVANCQAAAPVVAQVINGLGYIWESSGVKVLRLRHRIMGAMVGGITSFNSQVELSGLPLQLSPEEVTLALERGWVQLYELASPAGVGWGAAAPTAADGPSAASDAGARPQGNAVSSAAADDYYDDYYAEYAEGGGGDAGAGAREDPLGPGPQPAAAAAAEPGWAAAVRDGAHFQLPTTADAAARVNAGLNGAAAAASASEGPSTSRQAEWRYPATDAERARFAVFRDLYDRGFTLTSGVKFGGHYLCYPGDPKLYHAQFVVRVVPLHQPLSPILVKAWARGMHGARKHLLLASVAGAPAPGAAGAGGSARHVITYVTIARESGFVTSKLVAP